MASASWRRGEDSDVLAPFSAPADLFGEGRVLVLLPRDEDALVFAATTGAELVLRTTRRPQRTRSLTSGPPVASPWVATSVDSLRSPVILREVRGALADVPWVLWWPEALQPGVPGHGGRAAWIPHLREGFTGALLRRWSDGRAAPEGTEEIAGKPGALRFGEPAAAGGRAIARGPLAREWIQAAASAGQARREHDLRAPFPRSWRAAEAALRDSDAGVDLLAEAGGATPRGCTLLAAASGPWALAVPDGAAVAWSGEVWSADAGAGSLEDGSLIAWSGGGGVLEAWAAEGAVDRLWATWFEARIADHHRFRAPFVDREPEYQELHGAYTGAMQGWDLAERAAMALSDRGPRDLVALARALDRSPAWIADVLLSMFDDGILAGELRPRGAGQDWQAERPSGGPESLEGVVHGSDPRLASLWSTEGCRARALAAALSVSDPGDCGRCDRCDPSSSWRSTLAEGAVRADGPLAHAPSSAVASDLGSLFKGLGAAPSPPSGPPKPRAPRRRDAPLLTEDAPQPVIEAALVDFSPAELWVAAAYQHRGPSAGMSLPDEARDALLAVLRGEELPGSTVRHGDGGRVQIHLPGGPARGTHSFRPREAGQALLPRLAEHEDDGGPLAGLLALQQEADAKAAWLAAAEEALREALAGGPELPGREFSDGAGSESWLEGEGRLVRALRSLGDVDALASLGRARLGGDETLDDGPDRLCLRAIGALSPAPHLSPRQIRRWLDTEESLPAAVLQRVRGGGRRAWSELLEALPGSLRSAGLVAAVHERRLPEAAHEEALALEPGTDWEAAVLLALGTPRGTWPAAERGLPEQEALVAALQEKGEDGRSLAAVGRAFLDRVLADASLRASIVTDAEAGRVAAAFSALAERSVPDGPHFAPSAAEAAVLSRLRVQAAREQKAFTPALARALATGALVDGSVGEAGVAALQQAASAGWGGAMVALLGSQARRHPEDAARRAWLGRALGASGRWDEAQVAFSEADRLLGEAGLDLYWQGVEAVLAAAPQKALHWLEGAVRRGPSREISRRLALLAWGGGVPASVAEPLAQRLRDEGGGIWAGAMRALEQGRR